MELSPGKKPVSILGSTKFGFADGIGAKAQFYRPHSIHLNAQGDLLISDELNNRMRKVNLKTKEVTTWLGDGIGKTNPGIGTKSSVLTPRYFTPYRNGWLLVTGTGGIWHIDANAKLTLFSGQSGMKEGTKATAVFGSIGTMVLDAQENFYLSMSNRVVKLDKKGNLKIIAGTGTSGFKNGPLLQAELRNFASWSSTKQVVICISLILVIIAFVSLILLEKRSKRLLEVEIQDSKKGPVWKPNSILLSASH